MTSYVTTLGAWLTRTPQFRLTYCAMALLAGMSSAPYSTAQVVVSQEPLYLGGGGVPGNLVLTPSVEYPTIQSLANLGDYSTETRFEGYFDPDKCYEYVKGQDSAGNHFKPKRVQTSRNCTYEKEWSGNFLNWAVTQTIDPFRKVLTGGYRVKDTATETWLEKARHPGQSNIDTKELSGKDAVKAATPFESNKIKIKIQGLGKNMRFSLGDTSVDADELQYDGSKTQPENNNNKNKSFRATVRVKVCDSSVGLEDNCQEYSEGWKPEGVLQQNAERIRYSAFGYLNQDGNGRDGGVLRARQKYIGPTKFAGSQGFINNDNKEWNPVTGVLVDNPDPKDATASGVSKSGVINYINQFGQFGSGNQKSNDPVSELYYAATRYLKGQEEVPEYSNSLTDAYKDGFPVITNWHDSQDNKDPIQFACQPNVILGIGDTNTHSDGNLPGATYRGVDSPASPDAVTRDTTVNVTTMTNKLGQLEGIGDIGSHNGQFSGNSNTPYIAGLAYHNLTVDMRSDHLGKQTASTHWVDVLENQDLKASNKNQYYLAAKYGGFKVPTGFDPMTRTEALPNDWWNTNGDIVSLGNTSFIRPNNFYVAGQADKMINSLRQAFRNISSELSSSSSSIAANSTSLENETAIYQASFNSAHWSGELVAYELQGTTQGSSEGDAEEEEESTETQGSPTIADEPIWKVSTILDGKDDTDMDDRNILTSQPLAALAGVGDSGVRLTTTGSEFKWLASGGVPALTAEQKLALQKDTDAATVTEAVAQDRLEYLRGKRADERTDVLQTRPFRQRGSRLGDIINSSPVYVHAENFGYFRLNTTTAFTNVVTTSYADFRDSDVYKNRPPFLLVGANDGMLHAFNASVGANEGGGEELFAYVPASIIGELWKLTKPDYNHQYYVDGSPVISDAWLGSNLGWRTLAVGTTGAGGRSVFALDVTNPESMGASQVLWEFSHTEMGLAMQKPGLAALANGQFGVAVSSGYGRDPSLTTGKIWILDAATGEQIKEIIIPTGAGAELGSPLLIDTNADRIADRLYVADTHGKLWRVDIGSATPETWQAPAGLLAGATMLPLFEAAIPGANNGDPAIKQPITADLTAALNELGQIMVFFGTGSFQNVGDNVVSNTPAVDSFYGIIDRGVPVARNTLLEQEIIREVAQDGNKPRVRLVSSNNPTATHNGWLINLLWKNTYGGPGAKGERVVSQSIVRSDRVIFPTLIPSGDPCAAGGSSWLMEVDLYTGGRLAYEVFDTDNDGDIDEQDRVPSGDGDDDPTLPPSGIDPDIGIIQKPTIIENCKDGEECKIVSGSSGQAEVILEKGIKPVGRINWEQLR